MEIGVGRELGEMLNSEWLRTMNLPIGSSENCQLSAVSCPLPAFREFEGRSH
jgi:hypothetical protein